MLPLKIKQQFGTGYMTCICDTKIYIYGAELHWHACKKTHVNGKSNY